MVSVIKEVNNKIPNATYDETQYKVTIVVKASSDQNKLEIDREKTSIQKVVNDQVVENVDASALEFKNIYKIYRFTIKKVDADTGAALVGAEFELYADENCEIKVREGITDGRGAASG